MAVDQGPVSGKDKSPRKDESNNGVLTPPAKKKRSTSPRVRVVGGRIYDSVNGRTCHQCRQKTMDVVAVCKSMRKNKPCPNMYCHKCLLNRYGEKAEEVDAIEEWSCPRCRDVCNCSVCMKKRGHKPTGMLVNVAKATGHSSVSEFLRLGSKAGENHEEVAADTLISLNKEALRSPRKPGKENLVDRKVDVNQQNCADGVSKDAKVQVEKRDNKKRKQDQLVEALNEPSNALDDDETLRQPKKRRASKDDVTVTDTHSTGPVEDGGKKEHIRDVTPLPVGTDLKSVEGIEMCIEDVGNALQFLEFCSVFKEVLELKNGQPKHVLQDIFQGRNGRQAKFSMTVEFHIHLMSILLNERGEECSALKPNTWFGEFKNFLSASQSSLKAIGLNSLENEADYESFDASQKLRLLNLLCDEVLGTEKVREWMKEQHSKHAAKIKEAKQQVKAAKKEEKSLKQKMKDDIAKAIIEKQGAPLSISEHEAVIKGIKSNVEEAHAKVLESRGLLSKNNNKTSDVARIEPIYTGRGGNAYWNFNIAGESNEMLRQNVRQGGDLVHETWFALDEDDKSAIEKLRHCSASVKKRLARGS